jgi:uncharacterized protein
VASTTDMFDLGRLGLSSGEGRRLDLTVDLPVLALAGQEYRAPAAVPVRLDVSRTTAAGYSLRLRYSVQLSGPCMRCLEDAGRAIEIDAREVHQQSGGDELRSPYLDGDDLDLRSWARDSLALDLPAQIICRDDCRGICAICGANLNEAGPEHAHERAADPRWAKLSELRLD